MVAEEVAEEAGVGVRSLVAASLSAIGGGRAGFASPPRSRVVLVRSMGLAAFVASAVPILVRVFGPVFDERVVAAEAFHAFQSVLA